MYPRKAIFFEEIWKPITKEIMPYVSDGYFISSYGRVYSSKNMKYIRLFLDQDGYVNANLSLGNDRPEYRYCNNTVKVHRLVLAAFDPVENWQNLEVNHKDSVRSNNYLYNLEWATKKENAIHGLEYGYRAFCAQNGEANGFSKLTEKDVFEIVDILNSGNYTSIKDIANQYNIDPSVIYRIADGKAWKHLGYKINGNVLKQQNLKFSKDEIALICKFFQDHDINSYKSQTELFRDCLNQTGLISKADPIKNKNTFRSILRRKSILYKDIIDKYDYKFNG